MRVVKPLISIRSVIYDHPVDIEGLQASVIARRMARGARLFVAFHEDTPAGYLFAATEDCRVGEIDDWLRVEENEVYLYAAYTGPRFRGRRIYPHLVTRASDHFKGLSYEYAMIFSTGENVSSQKGIERSGFRLYEKVHYQNLLGWRSWRVRIGDRHVRSRLRVEY